MHEGYKKYLDFLESNLMANPMSQKQWMEAVGIEDEEEYTPFLSRQNTNLKKIEPTLQNHIKPSPAPQIKINIVDKPKKPKREPARIKLSEEQRRINKRENQKRWYRKTVGREVQDREYICLDGLTDEQKKERRLEQQRAYKNARKTNKRLL